MLLKERSRSGRTANEFPPFPSKHWHCPYAVGRDPALFDGHPRAHVNILFEFLFLGGVGGGTCIRHDRIRHVYQK